MAHAAVDLPDEERRQFVRSRCQDEQLVERVLQLAEEFEAELPQPEIEAGQTIDHFLIRRRLGSGGAGLVFEALDTELERTVALKVLRPGTAGSGNLTARMVREARTASALNHPNIITVHEVVHSGSTVALVMEYVSGKPLRDVIRTGVDTKAGLSIMYQIADALAAAHVAGIVHRDIKPENVIVRGDGQVKVLDFGLARSIDDDLNSLVSDTGSLAGTLRYLPPERCTGSGHSPAGDVFSLGLVFYELTAGRHPFPAESPLATMQTIVNETPQSPAVQNPGVPGGVDALILSMLSKAPEQRPQAREVVGALEAIRQQSTDPAPYQAVLKTRVWKRRWLVWAACILAAVGIAAFRLLQTRAVPRVVRSSNLTRFLPPNSATAAAISEDGRFVSYANSEGIFLRAVQTSQTQQLQAPPDFFVDRLAWYADGTQMAASGFSGKTDQPAI